MSAKTVQMSVQKNGIPKSFIGSRSSMLGSIADKLLSASVVRDLSELKSKYKYQGRDTEGYDLVKIVFALEKYQQNEANAFESLSLTEIEPDMYDSLSDRFTTKKTISTLIENGHVNIAAAKIKTQEKNKVNLDF